MTVREHLALSALIAISTEVATAAIGGLGSPTRWLIGHLAAMPTPIPGRALALAALAVLVAVNSVIVAHRVTEPDAPTLGRAAAGLILGLPLAVLEAAVLAGVWLVLRSG